MGQGDMALGSSVLRKFWDSFNSAFDVLKTLTKVDFLDQSKSIDEGFDGKYFADWLSDHGMNLIEEIKKASVDEMQDDDLLDCLDYNVFALSKAVATENADIIYATLADCLDDVKKSIDRVVNSNLMEESRSYNILVTQTKPTPYNLAAKDNAYEITAFSDGDTSSPEGAFSYAMAC